MNILLIAPASGPWRAVGRARLWNGRSFRFSLLSLLTVAAVTPREHRVEIVDEQLDEVPFERMPAGGRIDLVGITTMTAAAPRAYQLAARFRERGVPGVHLGTFAENANALRFFTGCGFARHGAPLRVPGFRTRGGARMHVQWMVRSL